MQISENEYVHSVYVHFLGDVLAHIPTTYLAYPFPTFHIQATFFNGCVNSCYDFFEILDSEGTCTCITFNFKYLKKPDHEQWKALNGLVKIKIPHDTTP